MYVETRPSQNSKGACFTIAATYFQLTYIFSQKKIDLCISYTGYNGP